MYMVYMVLLTQPGDLVSTLAQEGSFPMARVTGSVNCLQEKEIGGPIDPESIM